MAGKKVIRCGAELAQDVDSADFWAYLSIEAHKGQFAVVSGDGATAEGFALIRQSNEISGQDMLYSEPLRPQLRFSQMAGWNNDVNGLVYYEGEFLTSSRRDAGYLIRSVLITGLSSSLKHLCHGLKRME